jgi:hypothetical protein
MLGRFLLRMVAKIVARPVRRRVAAFHVATENPQDTQAELLRQILARQANTAFGRDHGFRTISTIDDYRRQVPFGPYEYVAPYIQRVMKGETSALLADPAVLMFALTSGTTAARKHIPITSHYLDDYRRGWNIWGLTAMSEHKAIVLKPVMQLVGDPEEYRTESGVACGNLSGFTAQVQKRIVRFLYSVPAVTGKIKDSLTRYYVALRFSLPRKVGLLSSANPSTLVSLARVMDQEKESLIRDIADGTLSAKLDIPAEMRAYFQRKLKKDRKRAAELESFAHRDGALLPSAAWPAESLLIGCWTGGSVGPYLRQLARYYGTTPVRDIGLLASEGRMTIPVNDKTTSGVLDITSHYFEFIPESEIDSPQPTFLGAHEVKEGGAYYILPTTKSGLYRYHISDLVRVTGFHNKTPLVEFLGKGNRFANLTGEKLSEHHVTKAMDAVAKKVYQPVSAYALAPCWDDAQPFYGLFLEETDIRDENLLTSFLIELDQTLGEQNIEYQAKRESGRLGPVRVQVIPTGTWQKWDRERLAKNGGSPEQYKHPCLIGDVNFRDTMTVIREIKTK